MEAIAVSAILAVGLFRIVLEYGHDLVGPPQIDIGLTTHQAAEMLFLRGENPYQSESITRLGEDPRFWGYHYGPFMVLGYGLSAVIPEFGFKMLNAVYLGVTVALVLAFATRPKVSALEHVASWVFAGAIVLLPERTWYELFREGVNDVFPVSLLMGSLWCVRSRWWLAAGVLAGLSFSAKFSPAAFFLVLFIRRRPERAFLGGVALGLLPLLAFALWAWEPLVNNVFLFHALKPPDTTSLQHMTPQGLRFFFPLFQLVAVGYVIARNFRRPVDYREVTTTFVLLLIVIEVTYKEVHANHLLWFLPLIAIVYTCHRYDAVATIEAFVKRRG